MSMKIAAVSFRAQIDVLDDDGLVSSRQVSPEVVIYEAELKKYPKVLELLALKGVRLGDEGGQDA